MKLEPVITLDKRNMATSKKFDDDIMSTNCNVIVIFPIYAQFGAIQKLDSKRMVWKTYFSLIVTFYHTKIEDLVQKTII